jgi:hypothetical protein
MIFIDPETVKEKAEKLIESVWVGPGEHAMEPGNWSGALGPAMLLKAAGTLHSMMLLMSGRGTVDALALLRTLYENVVILAWIAIDPDTRMNLWVATSAYWEIEEHRDWEKVGGRLRTEDELRDLEEQSGTGKASGLPSVPKMASEADEYWGSRVPGWSPTSGVDDPGLFASLRGLYRYIYQRGSAVVHSRVRGLDPHFVTVTDDTVRLHPEEPTTDYLVYNLGLHALAFGIAVGEQSWGWPWWREAMRVLEREKAIFGSDTEDGNLAVDGPTS